MSYSVSQSADFVIFVFGFLQAILTINDLKNKIYVLIAVFACIAREKPEEDMTKSKLSKILVLVLAITLFALALSACNIFDSVTKVTNVDISVESGLVDSNGDGVYEVTAGGQFKLTVDWHNILINNPTIRWFVAVNNGEKKQIDNAGDKTLTQTVVGDVGTRYSVSASVNSVDSAAAINIIIVEGSSGEEPVIAFTVELAGISDTNSNGYAEAKYGKPFTVSANLGSMLIADPTFDWFVKEDSAEEQKLEHTGSSFSFTINSRTTQKYEFRAVLKVGDGVDSTNVAKVEFVDSEVENASIASTSHAIAQGVIQQNVVDSPTDVVLVAHWNEDELTEDLVTFEWYVDGTKQAGKEENIFTFDVSGTTTACEKVVKVKITYKTKSVEAQITLSFVEEFDPIANVSVGIDTTGEVSAISGVKSAYLITVPSVDTASVEVSASVLPLTANLHADCTWTVRDSSGSHQDADKTSENELTLKYGKNVIKATVQNVESRSIIVYVLTAADYSDREYAIKSQFVWDGSVQDQYINNQEELNSFVGYLVSTHEIAEDQDDDEVREVYLAPSEWRDGANTTTKFATDFHTALEQGVDESGTPSIMHLGHRKFWLSTASVLGEPSGAYTPATPIEQRDVYVRYAELSDKRTKIPADDFTETLLVKNSNQLTHALTWGYKPTFENNAEGTRLATLYGKARKVLIDYVSADMTDIEKLQVIYDWIVNEIDYDYATAAYTGEGGTNFNAFYLEGVFDDHQAVCDGKSKAFALLCGMEGIRAMRIIGTANGGGHAWNKVLVDSDGDGIREWFFVDSTWGDNKLTIGSESKETLTYQYFLTTDAAMNTTHESDMPQPVCNTVYNCYQDSYVKVSSTKSVCQYITELQQLKDLRDYSSAHSGVYIQVKCANIAVETELKTLVGLGRVAIDEANKIYYIYGA